VLPAGMHCLSTPWHGVFTACMSLGHYPTKKKYSQQRTVEKTLVSGGKPMAVTTFPFGNSQDLRSVGKDDPFY